MRKSCLAIAAAGALAVALPGSAFGAVTIGSNLDSVAGPGGGEATWSQRTLLASHQAPGGLTSSINGVVVRWRVKAGLLSPSITFRVIRPGADASEATGGGTSPAADPATNTTTSFGLNPGLPIRVGDGIGIDPVTRGEYWRNEANIGSLNAWQPPLVDGAAPRAPSVFPNVELLLQAVIEPDKDGDRLGDESQDPDGGNPAPCTLVNAKILNVRVGNLVCL